MTRALLLAAIAVAIAWPMTATQRQYAADLWRDIQFHYQWPGGP